MRVRVRVLACVLAAAALVGLAGCSSDDKDDAATATTVPAVTTTAEENFTGDPNSIFCTLARDNATKVSQLPTAASTPEQLAVLLEDVAPAVREIVGVAPPELKDSVTVLAQGFEQMLTKAKEGEIDINVLADAEFQNAGGRLLKYTQKVCGVTG